MGDEESLSASLGGNGTNKKRHLWDGLRRLGGRKAE